MMMVPAFAERGMWQLRMELNNMAQYAKKQLQINRFMNRSFVVSVHIYLLAWRVPKMCGSIG